MNLLHPPRLRSLAREHALGTLTGGARRRFERLLHENAAARRELAGWQEHFAVLAAAVPEMRPRERVWQGLQQRLGLADPAGPRDPAGPVGAVGRVGSPQGSVPSTAAAESWWQRWFGARALGAALAGALIAVVAGGVLLQANPGWIGHEALREELPASYVGLLTNSSGQPALLLSSRRHGRVLTAKLLQPLPAPAGRAAVLWAYPKGGAVPFAVGTLAAATGSARLPLPDTSEKLFFNVERLGVSLEAAGALPAAPSGDLVLSGPCVKLW